MSGVEYYLTIKEMPSQLRPRERLLAEGAEVLSDGELLAILLGSGTRSVTAIDLASYVLSEFGSLGAMVNATVEELKAFKGIGVAKASQIKAALELAKRLSNTKREKPYIINSPKDVVLLVKEKIRHLDREHFQTLLLNTKHHVICRDVVSIGTLNSSTVHPRELFKNAIKKNAAALILMHNHPSGDPTPSKEDINVTKRLEEAGKIIGINILDHIIIGDNSYTSFKEKGLI